VTVKVQCENCGKRLGVPDEMAGQRQECPVCKSSVYVPLPEGELDELPLAPEDESDLAREAKLQEERRRIERQISSGERPDSGDSGTRGKSESPGEAKASASSGTSAEEAVMRYLRAMRDSDFDESEKALAAVRLQPRVATEIVDRLVADAVPPEGFENVPPPVFQGFLKNLRSNL
jgi:hypothetical protein